MIVAATATADPQYQIYDIGVAQTGDTASHGLGVSPAGIAVGRSVQISGTQAFTWTQGGGIVGLPNLAGRNLCFSNSANDSGVVVGTGSTTASDANPLPVIWQSGVVSQLPLPAGQTIGEANDVNASGVAVGSVNISSSQRGVIYSGGSASIITKTTSNGSYFAAAYGINDSGRVVGLGVGPNGLDNVGIVYDTSTDTAFSVGTFQGADSAVAYGVNNSGYVVGKSYQFEGGLGLPFIWSDAIGMVAVPLVDGTNDGSALGVNSDGWVVGTDVFGASSTPFLYDGTTIYRLADLLPAGSGWNLSINPDERGMSISDTGIIVGTGLHNGETRAYAMVPVPSTPTPTPTGTPTPTPTPTTTHFAVNAPGGVLQGFPFDVVVSARDQFNNTAVGYTGTVHFTSTDHGVSGTHLPADSTLTNGTGFFNMTLGTPGNQTVTATDTSNASITGASNLIFVQAKIFPTPSPTLTPTLTPSPTPTPTPPPPTPTPTPTPEVQTVNLSTRMRVQTGDNIGIGGFIITGTAPKHVLLRAIGPSLAQFGVPNALADPVMELHGPGAFVTITDNNWRDDPAQEALILATGIPPTNDLESAIDATLNPGAYTAVLSGSNDTSGVALIEVYDLSQAVDSKLANLSTRAFVGTSDNIVIGGFMLGGNSGDDGIVVRGIGPSLTAFGVPNALADPTLELRDGNGELLAANNNWQDNPGQAAELTAAGLAPTNQLESGIAIVLPPGPYTALLAGLNNSTGIGLVEVYDRGEL